MEPLLLSNNLSGLPPTYLAETSSDENHISVSSNFSLLTIKMLSDNIGFVRTLGFNDGHTNPAALQYCSTATAALLNNIHLVLGHFLC